MILAAVGTGLVSCGNTLEGEPETGGLAAKIGFPSIGVGRQETEPEREPEQEKGITICIDPGHGFDDPGCSSEILVGYEEKDLTLLYARMLKEELEFLGYTVILTHENETFPIMPNDNGNEIFGVEERAAYVNTLDVDYFVSLHCDSFETDYSVGGTRVYFCETAQKTSPCSETVSNAISACLAEEFPDVRTPVVHNMPIASSYLVLRETTAPASLIEIGFITNQTDIANLLDTEWQMKFVRGTAAGINSYFSVNP